MASAATKAATAAAKVALDGEKDAATRTSLRVHSPEAVLPRGRVLENWSICSKPRRGGVGGGCRNGLFGYFVRDESGVLKRVVWVGKKDGGGGGVCDWVRGEHEGGGEGDGDGKCTGKEDSGRNETDGDGEDMGAGDEEQETME